MFGNRVLRTIFGVMIIRETGEWRKLLNKELNYQYYSTNIVQVIIIDKKKISWAFGSMGRRESYTGFRWGNFKEAT